MNRWSRHLERLNILVMLLCSITHHHFEPNENRRKHTLSIHDEIKMGKPVFYDHHSWWMDSCDFSLSTDLMMIESHANGMIWWYVKVRRLNQPYLTLITFWRYFDWFVVPESSDSNAMFFRRMQTMSSIYAWGNCFCSFNIFLSLNHSWLFLLCIEASPPMDNL